MKNTGATQKIMASAWLFPAVCLIGLLGLTSLKISGTSSGSYYKLLYGQTSHDPNLLAGVSRPIRSDEWEWQTPMLAAQAKAGFPKINQNIGQGQDMAVIVDAPYKDWTTVFKPQNWAFFGLPFAYAQAFKWWLFGVLVVVSCYFFVLLLMPGKRLLATLLALGFFFSPFIQWWYQTITLAPIFYSFLMIIAVVRLWESKSLRTRLLWSLALAYFIVSFVIVLYPPFQIPCALAAAAFLVGYFIEKGYLKLNRRFWTNAACLVASVIIGAGLVGGFLLTNKAAVGAIHNSVYPGKRVSTSGHFDPKIFFGNFLDSQLQLTSRANNYVANQSEDSSFILLAPFLTLPVLYLLVADWRKRRRIEWALASVTILFGLFMIRLFVPGTDVLFKLLFLDFVPNGRLLIGIGLVGFMQTVLFIRHISRSDVTLSNRWTIAAYAAIVAVFVVAIGLLTKRAYPGYLHSTVLVILLAAGPVASIWLLLRRRVYPAVGLLLAFSLLSAGLVNPLYRGSGPLINSDLSHSLVATAQAYGPTGRWAVVDNPTPPPIAGRKRPVISSEIFENLPAANNLPSLTGLYAYPQVAVWTKAPEVAGQADIYNRYAHTVVVPTTGPTHLTLLGADDFQVVASPCSDFFQDEDVKYFLAQSDYSQQFSCLTNVKTIVYPKLTLYILRIKS